jgi:hypothetical protein
MDMQRFGVTVVVGVALLGLLGGCTGDADDMIPDGAGAADDTEPVDTGAGDDAGSTDGAAVAVITVDGRAYPADASLGFTGGACRIDEDPDRPGAAFVAYFAASGERVEFSLLQGSDEGSGSGDEVFRGSLGIGGDSQWRVESTEPWPGLDGDRSTAAGSLTMGDPDGNAVEVTYDITCQ